MARTLLDPDWVTLPDEALLDVRIADLPLALDGTMAARLDQLRGELAARGLDVPVHFYLSDDWFTPDGQVSVAVPFYLAHPRLEKLEAAQILEVEGGDDAQCLRILRHEMGHAIDNAYRLRLRRHRRKIFGLPSKPYPEFYTPRPYSKRFVLHLDAWYAQSHPDEDFAETFAVWLAPGSDWRHRYTGWRAIRKLEYMDALMTSLRGTPPRLHSAEEVEPLRKKRQTLRQHYRNKRRHYGLDYPNFYDRDLRRLFSDADEFAGNITAAQFIARNRRAVRRAVAKWTGIYQYTIDQVLEDMTTRCQQLRFRLAAPEDQARQEFTVLLTVQAMNHLHSGRHRRFL